MGSLEKNILASNILLFRYYLKNIPPNNFLIEIKIEIKSAIFVPAR